MKVEVYAFHFDHDRQGIALDVAYQILVDSSWYDHIVLPTYGFVAEAEGDRDVVLVHEVV